MPAWISVIVPTYNGAKYIAQALTSIENQAVSDVEVLVLDDGSTDDTAKIVESFSGRLRLQFHRLERCGNWVRVTNVGLSLATGAFASLLHQDDMWLPGRLAELRRLADSTSERSMVLSPSLFIDRQGRPLGQWTCPLETGPVEKSRLLEALLVQNFIAVPAPIVSIGLAREAGGLDEALWYTADWDFWLKAATLASTVVYHPQPLSAFRVHSGSQTVVRATAAAEMIGQQEVVVARHLESIDQRKRAQVERLARASIAVNRALTMTSSSDFRGWPQAAAALIGLGPAGAYRYFHRSRALERVAARLRARWRGDG